MIFSVFLAAFALYEITLYSASFVLPGSAEAFSAPHVWRIFYVNVIALAGLLIVHRVALAGLLVKDGHSSGKRAMAWPAETSRTAIVAVSLLSGRDGHALDPRRFQAGALSG
jgi:hypothetical protein